jgi:hypothetical protein
LVEVPLSSGPEHADGAAVTIRLSGGTRLVIVPGTDAAWFAQLLAALQG